MPLMSFKEYLDILFNLRDKIESYWKGFIYLSVAILAFLLTQQKLSITTGEKIILTFFYTSFTVLNSIILIKAYDNAVFLVKKLKKILGDEKEQSNEELKDLIVRFGYYECLTSAHLAQFVVFN